MVRPRQERLLRGAPPRPGEGGREHLSSLGASLLFPSTNALQSRSHTARSGCAQSRSLRAVGRSRFTIPITIGIAVLLAVLVVSYGQVIAVHPDGGGAYAVGKADLGVTVWSPLAGASLVVDYILTVAGWPLAAGAAPRSSRRLLSLHGHQLELCLAGLALPTSREPSGRDRRKRARIDAANALVFIAGIGTVIARGRLRESSLAHDRNEHAGARERGRGRDLDPESVRGRV